MENSQRSVCNAFRHRYYFPEALFQKDKEFYEDISAEEWKRSLRYTEDEKML